MALVILDPGHGGKDTGAVGNGMLEKDLALTIGLKVRNYLLGRYEVDVKMTREQDTFLSLAARAELANQLNANLFIALHHNAAGGTGFESYIYPGTRDQQTGHWQQILHSEIMDLLRTYGVQDRGRKEANFAVLRETRMPAILLENLFVDHPFDANLLRNASFIEQLSQKVAIGVAKALNLAERKPAPPPKDWKQEAVDWMFEEGLLTNEGWRQSIEDPLPLWAQAIVLRRLYEKMNGK